MDENTSQTNKNNWDFDEEMNWLFHYNYDLKQ